MLHAEYPDLGTSWFAAGAGSNGKAPQFLFTENETNTQELFGVANRTPYVKDAFHEYLVQGRADAVNPAQVGTKAAALYQLEIPPGGEICLRLRLAPHELSARKSLGKEFDQVFRDRIREADEFHDERKPKGITAEESRVVRQAYAGLLWSKQFYHYIARAWLKGAPQQPPPPASRAAGRNADWPHLYNRDVISMPDKWERSEEHTSELQSLRHLVCR